MIKKIFFIYPLIIYILLFFSINNLSGDTESKEDLAKLNDEASTITEETSQIDEFFLVRIGILSRRTSVDFFVSEGSWQIKDINGKVIDRVKLTEKVNIILKSGTKAPETFYRIVLLKTDDINGAIIQIEQFKEMFGEDNIFINHNYNNMDKPETVVERNRTWYICYGAFKTKTEAEEANKSIKGHDIISDCSNKGTGEFLIKISGDTQREILAKNWFRIQGDTPSSKITIKDVEFGGLVSNQGKQTRTYDGMLEFYIENNAKIGAVNEIDIEDYLCGVVPSEIGDDSPKESLKAQAVCARSETLAKIFKHKHKNDNFDLCADVHCQVYAGTDKKVARCSEAVKECRGEVLTYKGKIIEAVYSSNSGGHTENIEDIWESEPKVYFKGILDIENSAEYEKFQSLNDESVIKDWIENPPEAIYSHAEQKGMPNWAKKHFRWYKSYSGLELEQIVNKRKKIGKIKDIVLGKRGVGGRLKSINIIGEKGNLYVSTELPIRIALGNLDSAAFIIKIIEKKDGFIDKIVFAGAGWGHGVGMCQMGARIRALKGQNYKTILKSYFKNTEIKNIYSSDN